MAGGGFTYPGTGGFKYGGPQQLVDFKDSVRAATTAALAANTRSGNTLTADANGALAAQDGVTLAVGDGFLVKDEVTGANNGLYRVRDLGSAGTPWIMDRRSDADTDGEVTAGLTVWITEGTTNADTAWQITTNDAITLNTTALTFTQVSGLGQITAGAGMTKTGNTIDVIAADGTLTIGANSMQVALGATFAWTASHTWERNGIGTAQTNAHHIFNTTPAALGAQQYSGMTTWEGQAWDSTASQSKVVEFAIQNRPVQAAGNPTGVMDFLFRSNVGAWTKPMTLDSAGKVTVTTLGIGSWTISNVSDHVSTDTGYYAQPTYGYKIAGASGASWLAASLTLGAAFQQFTEMTPPVAGVADTARLYADVSGVKTRLMVIFQSGAAVQLAIEP